MQDFTEENGDEYVPRTMSNCFGDQNLKDSNAEKRDWNSNYLEKCVDQIRVKRIKLYDRQIDTAHQSTGKYTLGAL